MKGFSDDIDMKIGLSEWAKTTFKKDKLEKPDHVQLDEEQSLKIWTIR